MRKYFKGIAVTTILVTHHLFANPLALMSAVPDESKLVLQKLQHKHYIQQGLYHYWTGQLAHHHVVLMNTGVGLVNAAVATSQVINQFHPKAIIFFGTAGAASTDENVGNVKVVQYAFPFDLGNINSKKPQVPPGFTYKLVRHIAEPALYSANKNLLALAKNLKVSIPAIDHQGKSVKATLALATIASGQHFPNTVFDTKRLNRYHIPIIAMETAAIYQVCWMYKQPCIAFRSVSDLLSPYATTAATQWNHSNAMLASNNAEKVALQFIKKLD